MNSKQIKTALSKLALKTPKWLKNKDGSSKPFAQGQLKLNGKLLTARIPGVLFFTPTRQEHEEYGLSYRFGVQFDENEVEFLDDIINKMEALMGDDVEVKPPHNEGTIYFKLAPNNKQTAFQCDINIPIAPSKLKSEDIEQGMDVTVEFKVTPWYRRDENDEKQMGLALKVKKLFFGEEPKPKAKKRKSTVDEELLDIISDYEEDQAPPTKKKLPTMSKEDKKILYSLNH